MYKGEAVNVTLRGHKTIADAVVDAFGHKMMMPTDADHFTVNVYVEVSPTFFAWLTNFGKKIELVNPPNIRKQYGEYLKGITELYK